MAGKIKRPQARSGSNKIKVNSEGSSLSFNHPIFCFKYLDRDYGISHCTGEEKKALIDQLIKLSTLDWVQLKLAPRHGMGSEKIAVTSINRKLPLDLTPDVNYLLAFRFDGKKCFVGFRNQYVFHVLFIDRDFSLYKH